MFEILPHIEQLAIRGSWNPDTNVLGNAALAQTDIPGFYCPSRRNGIRTGSGDHLNLLDPSWRGGGNDYGGCYGNGWHRFCSQGADTGTPTTATPSCPRDRHDTGRLNGISKAAQSRRPEHWIL